jgi:ribosomal protein S18 acetylase RimI-like enzyme
MATIRQASTLDAEAISSLNVDVQALHAAAFPQRFKRPSAETFPPSAAAALLAEARNLVFIAESDGQPAGYAYAEIIRNPENAFRHRYDMIYLHHISVRPQHRNKGIGRALLQAIRSAAQNNGIDVIATEVWSFNEAARRFFRESGFDPYIERLWTRAGQDG